MKLVTVFTLILSLALELVRYLQRREDYDKAKLAAAAELMERANELVKRAATFRADVDHGPDAVVQDEFNRDERKPNGNGTKP